MICEGEDMRVSVLYLYIYIYEPKVFRHFQEKLGFVIFIYYGKVSGLPLLINSQGIRHLTFIGPYTCTQGAHVTVSIRLCSDKASLPSNKS